VRPAYFVLGCLCVALAFLGVLLPLLPATPFLLVATWCFARSSPRCARALREAPLFGPLIDDWERHRALTPRVKGTALAVLGLGVAATIVTSDPSPPALVLLAALALCGAIVVLRIPTLREPPPRADADPSPEEG
jgi:uncharacterized membrane protein YbaN (DUF454 family)